MTFGRQRIAAAAVLPLLLGACSGDPEPKFAPPSVSPSVSETPAPTAEPSREPWERKSEAGAVAFARFWVDDVFSAAINDGDTARLKAYSDEGCGTCKAFVDRIESIRDNGGFYRSASWKVLQADAKGGVGPNQTSVAIRVLQGREVYKNSADDEIVRHAKSKATYEAVLQWRDGAWLMVELAGLT